MASSAAASVMEEPAAEIIDPMDEDDYMDSHEKSNTSRRRDSESSAAAEENDGDDDADAESSDYNTSGSEWQAPRSLRPPAAKRKKVVKVPVAATQRKQQQQQQKSKQNQAGPSQNPDYGVSFFPTDDPNYQPFIGEENEDWHDDDGRVRVQQLLNSSESDPCTDSGEDELPSCSESPSSSGIGETCLLCKGRRIVHLEFEISADGVTMQKKAVKDQFWPLMGQLISVSPCIHVKETHKFFLPRLSKPIVIGFYHGSTKPQCANEYLACVFKEMQLAEKHRLCTSFLKFFIGDGPARQFIKGFPSHAAYCGCER